MFSKAALSGKEAENLSWVLLISLSAVIAGSLWLLSGNVLYTEGEVMQGLFKLLSGLVAGFVLIGFRSRKLAAWSILVLGGFLLLWQAYQSRKWAVIHEEIIAIVRFAEDAKARTSHYPTSLGGYTFKSARVKSHIYKWESDEAEGFRLTYFMNDPGITYWYSSKTGFGYYPD